MSLTKLLSARIVPKRLTSFETPVSGLGAPTTTLRLTIHQKTFTELTENYYIYVLLQEEDTG